MLKAAMRQRVNATSASIPGPTMPLYLAGAPVLEVFPVLPLIANAPLGVGALSYAGALTLGIVADRDAYPDLNVLAAGMRDDLHAFGVPTSPASGLAGPDARGAPPYRDREPAADPGDDVRHAPDPLVVAERR